MFSLIVARGPDAGRTVRLPEREPQLVGRSTEAFDLHDATISRRHAELTPEDGRWIVRDLDSRHGTFVNGVRLAGPVPISAGDRLRCGDTEFLVVRDGGPGARIDDDGDAPPIDLPRGGEGADAATLRALLARAAEPTDADVLLAEVTRAVAAAAGCEALALRAVDASLTEFLVPSHAGSGAAPHAPLALVRAALRANEPMAAREPGATLLVAPVAHDDAAPCALLLRRPGNAAPDARDAALLADAARIAALGLAARTQRSAHGAHERLALIGETVASLSHSIKNMLQGLRFGADAVDLALSRGELAKAQEGWPILQRNLDRVQALVLNMLAWAKERPLEPEPLDANELVREVRELLAPAAGRRRVAIVLALDEDLPPASLDAPAVHQALTNLALNAVEAAPERTGLVTLASRYDEVRDEVVLAIADNGAGIPDAIRARLFEPFVSTKGQRGTGLGLAVARKIAERHGGRLTLAASSPSGTTMELALPASRGGEDPAETRSPKGLAPGDYPWKFG
ncbi:MAG: ATP-binding protein [Planctomycetota bacterium]